MSAVKVGQIMRIDGEDYVVNRIQTVQTKLGDPARATIDLMHVDEIRRRKSNLEGLMFQAGIEDA